MLLYWYFILLSTYCLCQDVAQGSGPLVETKVGSIRGLLSSDGSYSMFMGIPFGLVNISNPFGEAIEYPNFEDVFEAYSESAICPQFYQYSSTILGTLDCLQVNIYVPSSATSSSSLPVMVWIYGGGFAQGSSRKAIYGPDFLVRHNVILVTINYRVGPYGFMCLDIPEVPGNQGLKDQLLGMRWVKNNIEAFGGDVNRITLFGQSAGGHSVELHLRSPKEKLYNNIIMQSGSSVASTVLIAPDRDAPIKIAERQGLSTGDVYEALAFLATLDPNVVVASSLELGIIFKPCVEREFRGVDNFISSSWIDAPVPKIENVPVLLGFNEHELMAPHINRNDEYFEGLNIFSDYINQTFEFSNDEIERMVRIVRQFYIGDEDMNTDVKWSIIEFDSDFTYIHPIYRSIEKFLEGSAGYIFFYMFSYIGGRNLIRIRNITNDEGIAHSDELGYLFDMEIMPQYITSEDQLMIDRMTTMWTNFAKYSNPIPERTNITPITWAPLTSESFNYLRIDSELRLGRRPVHERMAFWDLFYEMNREFQRKFEPSAAGGLTSHFVSMLATLVGYYWLNY